MTIVAASHTTCGSAYGLPSTQTTTSGVPVLLNHPATSPVVKEANSDFEQALVGLRDLTREVLGTRSAKSGPAPV